MKYNYIDLEIVNDLGLQLGFILSYFTTKRYFYGREIGISTNKKLDEIHTPICIDELLEDLKCLNSDDIEFGINELIKSGILFLFENEETKEKFFKVDLSVFKKNKDNKKIINNLIIKTVKPLEEAIFQNPIPIKKPKNYAPGVSIPKKDET